MADGAISAPPTPCTARPTTSTQAVCAAAATIEPPISTTHPALKILRAPIRSDRRPPSSSSPPKAMTYALNTHCNSPCEKPRSFCISGSATPMIDVSMITMNCAVASTRSAHQRLGLMADMTPTPSFIPPRGI